MVCGVKQAIWSKYMPDKGLKAGYSCAVTRFGAFLSCVQNIHLRDLKDLQPEVQRAKCDCGGHCSMSLVSHGIWVNGSQKVRFRRVSKAAMEDLNQVELNEQNHGVTDEHLVYNPIDGSVV